MNRHHPYSTNRNSGSYNFKKSKSYLDREKKALTERFYLISEKLVNDSTIEFEVMGSTCNVYTLVFSDRDKTQLQSCSCPDFTVRKNYCKHCIFIEKRVLKGTKDLWTSAKERIQNNKKEIGIDAPQQIVEEYQKRKSILEKEHSSPEKEHSSPEKSKDDKPKESIENKPTSENKTPNDDCPICFETLAEGKLIFCVNSCKNAIHLECFEKWKKMKKNTCVLCRAEIPSQSSTNSSSKTEKNSNNNSNFNYINLQDVLE